MYGNTVGRYGRAFVDYFPQGRRKSMGCQSMHYDPEFETFTYGDPTPPKASLRNLKPGDFLALYCGLQEWDEEQGWLTDNRPALYLVGYFEVALAGMASDFDGPTLQKEFANNFHVRYSSVFKRDKKRLVLVKGGPGSKLFNKAYCISHETVDRNGSPLKVLSASMRKVFGNFTGSGCNAIQRSTPRWVDARYAEGAISHLRSLE